MNNTKKRRGLLASAGVVAFTAALAFGGAASAEPTILPDETVGNLHITKLTTPDGGPAASTGGVVLDDLTGYTAIEGVTFTVTPIAPSGSPDFIDLHTNEGWEAAAEAVLDLSGPTPVVLDKAGGTALSLGDPIPGYTDASGIPRVNADGSGAEAFQNLPLGLYLVQETFTPADVVPSLPFVVAIPLTHPTELDTWMYDVYVYPKNARLNEPTKSVEDADATAAPDTVTWTIETDVPRLPGAEAGTWATPTLFQIKDQLDSRLAPESLTVEIVTPGDPETVETLASPGDYEFTPTQTWNGQDNAGAEVAITFTANGLAALAAAAEDDGSKVRVTLGTSVLAGTVGEIPNDATVYVNDPEVGVDTNEVETKWGELEFTKVDGSGGELEGAEFNVYASLEDAQVDQNALFVTGDPDSTGNLNIESDENGVVSITGLRYSDFADGVVQQPGVADGDVCVANEAYNVYWLAEVKAPAGFELLATPIPFIVTEDGGFQITVDADGAPVLNNECGFDTMPIALNQIENVPSNGGFGLPLTGGSGTALLTITGLALLGAVAFVARRRSVEA